MASISKVKLALLITIDGPAGAGKTTVSRGLADRMGYRYIDTGALYRGVAYGAVRRGILPEDDNALSELCQTIDLQFKRIKGTVRLLLNGQDISAQIRSADISMMASAVSARSVVRSFLLDVQKEMGKESGVVFEGRDMGTVVFPNADIKFFLDASIKVRALRRFNEMAQGRQTLAQVEADIRRRDKKDRSRTLAPLKPADDAIVIDSTDMSVEGVIQTMFIHISEKQGQFSEGLK